MTDNYWKNGLTKTIGYFCEAQQIAAPTVRHFR